MRVDNLFYPVLVVPICELIDMRLREADGKNSEYVTYIEKHFFRCTQAVEALQSLN